MLASRLSSVLLCVTVLSCLAMPFTSDVIQIACSCLVIASWGAFVSVNYALVVKKKCREWGSSPFLDRCLARLIFSAIGFFIGWGIAAVMTTIYGAHSDAFHDCASLYGIYTSGGNYAALSIPEHHDHAPAAAGRIRMYLPLSHRISVTKSCSSAAVRLWLNSINFRRVKPIFSNS